AATPSVAARAAPAAAAADFKMSAGAAEFVPGKAATPEAPSDSDAAALAKEAGTVKYKEGSYREALVEYRRALELLPESEVERRVQLLGNVGAACLMLRKTEECATACQEALVLDPLNSKIRARLASAKVACGDFEPAREILKVGDVIGDATLATALKQVGSVESDLARADAAQKNGEPARALGLYAELEGKALFDFPAMTIKQARCNLDLKNYPRVLQATQTVLRSNPRNIDALVLRTEALYRNHSNAVESKQWAEPLEQGQRLLKEALSFDPDHVEAQALRKRLRLLGLKHAELKELWDNRQFEEAQAILDIMIEHSHDNPVMMGSLYCHRALAGLRMKDWRS
ncbi:unnamed protein product, partial [Polarella glacialis]